MGWVHSELDTAKASGRSLQDLRDEMERRANESEEES